MEQLPRACSARNIRIFPSARSTRISSNAQNLVERIYTRDTIGDNILEHQMERSDARELVTKTVLCLLRKKRLVLL